MRRWLLYFATFGIYLINFGFIMRVILTNDDGIQSEGIAMLEQVISGFSFVDDLWIFAPSSQKSGCGHSVTNIDVNDQDFQPITLEKLGDKKFAVHNATPVECVMVAMAFLENKPPDIVISGVNYGLNYGWDVFFSGTVGAARQANFNGIPSIALSQSIWIGDKIIPQGQFKCILNNTKCIWTLRRMIMYLTRNNEISTTKDLCINISLPVSTDLVSSPICVPLATEPCIVPKIVNLGNQSYKMILSDSKTPELIKRGYIVVNPMSATGNNSQHVAKITEELL